MNTYYSTLDTQIGPFTVIADEQGTVLASGWTGETGALLPQIHRSLRDTPVWRAELGPVTTAIRAYHEGDLTAPDTVPVRQTTDG